MKRILLLSVFQLFFVSPILHAQSLHAPTRLQTEALTNPLAIDNIQPHFSWHNTATAGSHRQTAYQVLVASSEKQLREGRADLWDSGRQPSDASIWVAYQGKTLAARQQAVWRVRVWDEDGKPSAWSATARLGIGLLHEHDWTAQWIAAPAIPTADGSPRIAADGKEAVSPNQPIFLSNFSLKSTRRQLLLHVNSLGYHEVWLNGQRVSDDVLAPAVSESGRRSVVCTYDLSSLAVKGTNRLKIIVGKGWYNNGLPGVVTRGPFLRAQLEQGQGAQWQTVLTTDATWRCRESGYTSSWRKMKLGGDLVDGRALRPLPSQHSGAAPVVAAVEPVGIGEELPVVLPTLPADKIGKATPQMVEPNRIQQELRPISCVQVGDTTWYYDMGRCFTGWTRVQLPRLRDGPAGAHHLRRPTRRLEVQSRSQLRRLYRCRA